MPVITMANAYSCIISFFRCKIFSFAEDKHSLHKQSAERNSMINQSGMEGEQVRHVSFK